MNGEYFEKIIPISQLLLDNKNPRLPEIKESQYDSIRTMASIQGDKIIVLAENLVKNGPNPAERPIVIQVAKEKEIYYIIDGNRRVAALKLLESLSIAEGIFSGSKLKKLKKIADMFEKNPITELACVVFPNKDETDKWIQLIHRGQQKGAGLVKWDGQVAARYDARKSEKRKFAYDLLMFVKDKADLSEKTKERINKGKFQITNLERLIGTPYVRKKLGIELLGGKFIIVYPGEEILKGLRKVVDDIGTGRITVSDIKKEDQRWKYINRLSVDELPAPEKKLTIPRSLGEISSTEDELEAYRTKKRRIPIRPRASLIPKNLKLYIADNRINTIFSELQNLNLDDFPNAGAVMLRVFIELSLVYFLEKTIKLDTEQVDKMILRKKFQRVIDYFKENKIMTNKQLDPIRRHASAQTLLAASYKTLHGYVHSPYFMPRASELKIAWDESQLFIEKLFLAQHNGQ